MVKVRLGRSNVREVVEGTPICELIPAGQPIIAAKLDGELVGLNTPLIQDAKLEYVLATDIEGLRVHHESLIYILTMAAQRAFPSSRLVVEHSTSKGFYCTLRMKDRRMEKRDVELLEAEMLGLMADDMDIYSEFAAREELEKICKANENFSKLALLVHAKKEHYYIHRCSDFTDWARGPLVPSTGSLAAFELRYYPPGFILRFPTPASFPELPPFVEQPKLFLVFHHYEEWGEALRISDIGQLNKMIAERKSAELVNIAEALHEKAIARIADRISRTPILPRIVLIAGPSSAGKTTFAKRLAVHLRVNGLRPLPLSVDDYFLDRSRTPLDVDGKPDFETLEAVDLEFFNQQLVLLLEGKTVDRPRFDFEKGKRYFDGTTLNLAPDEILIVEGIHALNPRLTSAVPKHLKFRVYVSALTQLNYHDQRMVSTSDTRMLRRMMRDYSYRDHTPTETLKRWPSVRRGEEMNIFPYQETADEMFNSALIYELSVMRNKSIKLLRTVKAKGYKAEAQRMLDLLELVMPADDEAVPPASILREFIGGSIFRKRENSNNNKKTTSKKNK
ncbi:nucleoside kinase [candidate division WOR-3 bacterium]|uniref:Nucleoside kinase n=1 Tax=candidate division WOR-3 bacterium TaxID=2052148 RepID=A0A9D5QC55_UNCW3|nr:nucleoside kinase [candidate division WOR-3 bacterium]MBD3363687.1 nucleoside kinase [candidate division WOR-3 bacterium]